MKIEIKQNSNKIDVFSPYNPEFPSSAKSLGGRWNSVEKCWSFDSRDEENVRKLCQDIYGTDGTESELVTVRIAANRDLESDYCDSFYLFGRQIARATGRDSGAYPCDGVVVVSGRKFQSGGSRKNWKTIIKKDTVFEVRDVPKLAVENEDSYDYKNYCSVEIVENTIDRSALIVEREKLLARIAEIDKVLED